MVKLGSRNSGYQHCKCYAAKLAESQVHILIRVEQCLEQFDLPLRPSG